MKFKNIKKKMYKKSPSNSRTIPAFAKASTVAKAMADKSPGKAEHFKFSFPKISSSKLLKLYGKALKISVVIIFTIAVVVVGIDLKSNLQTKQSIDSQRETLTKDLKFWEDFISKQQNYPDAYFQAAILEYRLGDISKIKKYIKKGLVLDPNSEAGRKIEKMLK